MTGFDFSPLFRSTVGFDRLNRLMESARVPENDSAYPPYNIEKTDENHYRITVAVAGFAEDDLDVTVKENTLTISGKMNRDAEEDGKRQMLHRGIAGRAFRLNFALADAVVVHGADLENGLLHIALERVVPEEAKPRKIEIASGVPEKIVEGKAA
ncbi:MAG TPA: Hsp20 family protein [Alphaproteobacteria bacterium]|nr:Hsp20 family protein [Alphaproteobacteria bacterium]